MSRIILNQTRIVVLTVALAFGLSRVAAFAQTNMLHNGGFEIGPAGIKTFPGWDAIGPADTNSDYGVATSSVFPDVAENGTNYAFFHGNPTDGSQDCLGQTVHLVVGAPYTISYYLGTDGTTLGSGAGMWAEIGTDFSLDYANDVVMTKYRPNSSNALPYQQFTSTIIATNATEILSFHGIDATSSILLDNVWMTPATPQLNVTLSPTNTLILDWLSATTNYVLQANAALETTNWTTLTNRPVTTGPSNQIVLPAPIGSVFYRLAAP